MAVLTGEKLIGMGGQVLRDPGRGLGGIHHGATADAHEEIRPAGFGGKGGVLTLRQQGVLADSRKNGGVHSGGGKRFHDVVQRAAGRGGMGAGEDQAAPAVAGHARHLLLDTALPGKDLYRHVKIKIHKAPFLSMNLLFLPTYGMIRPMGNPKRRPGFPKAPFPKAPPQDAIMPPIRRAYSGRRTAFSFHRHHCSINSCGTDYFPVFFRAEFWM